MGCGVQPAIIIRFGLLVSLMMRRRIERKDMMRMIKLMREEVAIKCPATCVRKYTDEQRKYDGVEIALFHVMKII